MVMQDKETSLTSCPPWGQSWSTRGKGQPVTPSRGEAAAAVEPDEPVAVLTLWTPLGSSHLAEAERDNKTTSLFKNQVSQARWEYQQNQTIKSFKYVRK